MLYYIILLLYYWVAWVRVFDVERPETPNDPRIHHWWCVPVHLHDVSFTYIIINFKYFRFVELFAQVSSWITGFTVAEFGFLCLCNDWDNFLIFRPAEPQEWRAVHHSSETSPWETASVRENSQNTGTSLRCPCSKCKSNWACWFFFIFFYFFYCLS